MIITGIEAIKTVFNFIFLRIGVNAKVLKNRNVEISKRVNKLFNRLIKPNEALFKKETYLYSGK